MSIRIYPIRAFDDNYIWLLQKDKQAIAVDMGDDVPVRAYLHEHQLELVAIWVTHDHHDHVGGVANLLSDFAKAKVYCHARHQLPNVSQDNKILVDEGDEIIAWDNVVKVWQTFGHTDNHLSFILDQVGFLHVFCGDTLFSGGCGRVFTGTLDELYYSLERYQRLPDDTLFYPAHEYTLSNLRFGQAIEPDNADIAKAIANITQNPSAITLPTSLATQKNINVFMRTHLDGVKHSPDVKALLIDVDDDVAVFAALRQLKSFLMLGKYGHCWFNRFGIWYVNGCFCGGTCQKSHHCLAKQPSNIA